MSKLIDKRRIHARNDGQEYAHQYEKQDDYQYPNEDKRIKYHVNSDNSDEKNKDQLYSIQTEVQQPVQPENRIKVRLNNEDILEETRQRSYKIKNTSPIWDKTDPGQDSYQLANDPRQDEVDYIQQSSNSFSNAIQEENSLPLNTPVGRTQSYQDEQVNSDLTVGLKVAHVEEGIKGEIKFIGKDKIAVIWEDNTRERFNISEAKKCLIAYVDSTQQEVAPLETTPFPKEEENNVIDKALKAVEDENIEIKEATQNIDIEKIKLKREVNELKNQIKTQDIDKIKRKATNELIDLMQKKGMLGYLEEEVNKQFETIMKMDDIGFEAFQNAILTAKTNVQSNNIDDVLSVLEDEDFSDIEDGQEYAKAKELAKKASTPKRTVDGIEMGDTSFFENGGLKHFKPVVGDFQNIDTSNSTQESRNISAANKKPKAIEKKASDLDLSGFENLQGLTQPINIAAKDIPNAGGKFQELFKDLNWTLISKH